jgi:hypothetical protein
MFFLFKFNHLAAFIQVFNTDGSPLTGNNVLIGHTYYATSKQVSVAVFNDGPVPIQYVIVPTANVSS